MTFMTRRGASLSCVCEGCNLSSALVATATHIFRCTARRQYASAEFYIAIHHYMRRFARKATRASHAPGKLPNYASAAAASPTNFQCQGHYRPRTKGACLLSGALAFAFFVRRDSLAGSHPCELERAEQYLVAQIVCLDIAGVLEVKCNLKHDQRMVEEGKINCKYM